jgi:hypothetical protein
VLAPWPASQELQAGTSTFKPFHSLLHLALIERIDKTITDLPPDHNTLMQELATHRANEDSQCQVLSEMQEAAVLRLVAYIKVDDHNFANARFLDLKETVDEGGERKVSKVVSALASETTLRKMVKDLTDAFEKHDIDMTVFTPNQFAALSVYYAQFLTQATTKTKHWLNRRYCCGLKQYVPGNEIEPKDAWDVSSRQYVAVRQHEHLASQCLPKHYDDSSIAQSTALEQSGQAIASAPIVCELCHKGFSGFDTFIHHCRRKHKGFAEYRKRTIYKARESGMQPLLPWLKRQMAQSFQFFRFFCAPGMPNEWMSKTHESAVPRREEACAVCACKAWVNQRYEVYLFKEATGTTTWARHFRYGGNDEEISGEEHDEDPRKSRDSQPAQGGLLVEDSGAFCVGPRRRDPRDSQCGALH